MSGPSMQRNAAARRQAAEHAAPTDGAGASWIAVGRERDLSGPGPFAASAAGVELVIVRAADGLRAYDGRCPHQGALLAEGELSGGELVCRNHGWRFDAATGCRRGGPGCLRAHAVEVRGGEVLVRVAPEPAGPSTASLRAVDELPGPRGVPLLGNTLGLDLERLHVVLDRWRERYGPVFRFDLGTRRVLVTSEPAHIQRALRERPETFRRVGSVEPVFRELGIDGVFSAEGAEWRPLRRLTMEALAPARLRSFYPALRDVAERLQRRWGAAADAGRPIDVVEDFKRFTVDLTTRLTLGHDLDTLEQEGDVLQRRLEVIFPALTRRLFAVVPLWRAVKLPADRRLERALAEVFAFLRQVLEATRARLEADRAAAAQPATFLEAMILARDDAGRPFTDRQILGNAIELLLAGEDTTALTLSWAVHELCEAPQAVRDVQAEADAVLAGEVAPRDADAAARLHVAGAVAQETMRLRPVAPVLFMEANGDTALGDVAIPRGQRIILLARPQAVSPAHFADPAAFRPGRWLGHAPGAAHEPAAHIPFGSGPRLCPGRSLALLEMRVALATVLGSFSLERVGERDAVEERFAFTMGPRGLRVRLARRRRDAFAGTAGSPRG